MLKFLNRSQAKPASPRPAIVPVPQSAPHRQRYGVEVAYYYSPAELDDCLAVPVSGRRVILYGGRGPLPSVLAEVADRVVRVRTDDPLDAAVTALAGVRDGDTLMVLLPADWDGPPAEAMLDHARRWFASPHSSEDEQVG